MKYNVYKGVQMPLVFKWGLKGRYISWAGIVAIAVFLSIVIGKTMFGWGVALIIGVLLLIIGGGYIAYKAKDGVYSKDKTKGIVQIKTRREL